MSKKAARQIEHALVTEIRNYLDAPPAHQPHAMGRVYGLACALAIVTDSSTDEALWDTATDHGLMDALNDHIADDIAARA